MEHGVESLGTWAEAIESEPSKCAEAWMEHGVESLGTWAVAIES